jgi:hypothetical protein
MHGLCYIPAVAWASARVSAYESSKPDYCSCSICIGIRRWRRRSDGGSGPESRGYRIDSNRQQHRALTTPRRFPPPWSIEETLARFISRDSSGQAPNRTIEWMKSCRPRASIVMPQGFATGAYAASAKEKVIACSSTAAEHRSG